MQQQKITLIGAGLVGSLCAVFLARRGFQVEIFERRPDMRKETIAAGRSINLALANRGILPLEQAALMEQVNHLLTPMKGRMIHNLDGHLDLQLYGQKKEEVIYSISRTDLNTLCMNAAEGYGNVTIHFNQSCVDVDFDNNELLIKDQLKETHYKHPFNRLIGTDGSASAVRDAIHRNLSNFHHIDTLQHSYKELCIPASANGHFQMEPNALHIWPRSDFMLIALPNKDATFTVTLFMPNAGDISFAEVNNQERLFKLFEQKFADAKELIPNLAQDYFDNPTGSLATVCCDPWHYQAKALLIGDAAHAIVPFHGQGMNCGFEDVLELDNQIALHSNNWEKIFSATAQARMPNANAIADMAIENYQEMRDSVNQANYQLKKQLSFELESRWPNHFIPRYSMVMFHHLPYSEAQSRGNIQNGILTQLTENISAAHECNFAQAERLIKERLPAVDLNR